MSAGHALFDTPLGPCGIAWAEGRVTHVQLPEATRDATAARVARRSGAPEAETPRAIAAVIADIGAMLAGEPRRPDVWPLDLSAAPDLHRRVYALLLAVPYGETTTYGALARGLGDVALSQAVGRAMATNPVPILVPCHRVLGEGGRAGGFSGGEGARTKIALLNIERAATPGGGLFDALPLALRPA